MKKKFFVIGATLFVMGFVACTQPSQPTSGAIPGVVGRTLQPTASQPTVDDYVPDIETSSKDENLDDDTLKKLKTVGKKVQHTFSSGEKLRYVMTIQGDVIVGGSHGTIITDADGLPKFIKGKEHDLKSKLKSQGVGIAPWRGLANDTKWPHHNIPYIFSGFNSVTNNQKITNAINWWNSRVGIQYIPYTNQPEWVVFTVDSSKSCGEASSVGKSGWVANNNIYTSPSCTNNRALLHEMAHTAGLFHEQQRCDRDSYVYVSYPSWDFAQATQHEKKCWSDILDYGVYDYSSLMHYKYGSDGTYSWLWYYGNIANNPPNGRLYSGDWTDPAEAVGLAPIIAPNIGSSRYTLSRNDILSINTLYGDIPNFNSTGGIISWNMLSSSFGHQSGRFSGGGWSSSVGLDPPGNWMVYGPYYAVSNINSRLICCSVNYELMVDNAVANNDPVAVIEVNSVGPSPIHTQRSLISRTIRRGDFDSANQYKSFELVFKTVNLDPTSSLEFRVLWVGSSYVHVRTINLRQ
jgi:hypothetical protein